MRKYSVVYFFATGRKFKSEDSKIKSMGNGINRIAYKIGYMIGGK